MHNPFYTSKRPNNTEMEKLLQFLNSNPSSLSNSDEISEEIKKYMTDNKSNLSKEDLSKMELERLVLLFGVNEGVLTPKFANYDYDGNVIYSFPDINNFNSEAFDYIKERFEDTENLVLKAHFGQFLDMQGEKHGKYLEQAQESYIQLIRNYIDHKKQSQNDDDNNGSSHQIVFYLQQLLYISIRRKSLDDVKGLFLELLNDHIFTNMWYAIIHEITDSKKVFTMDELSFLPNQVLKMAETQEREWDKIYHYRLGEKISHKVQDTSINWKENKAIAFEKLANERTDLASVEFANKSSRLYELIGDKESAKRMAELYSKKASNMNLSTFGRTEDVTDYAKESLTLIDKLKELQIQDFIDYLIHDNGLLIEIEQLDDLAKETMRNNRMRYMMGHQIIDVNGHVSKNYSTPEELFQLAKFDVYGPLLQKLYQYRIDAIILEFVTNVSEWNADNLIDYFSTKTWYGFEVSDTNSTETFRVIDLVSHGLISYFDELEKTVKDPSNLFNFILAMDSLVLKFEAILRQICKHLGIQTYYTRPDEEKRNVTKEKDINMLLREDGLTTHLGGDLTFFIKYVLVERSGFNLRNDIAHGFTKPKAYMIYSIMNMIVMILIKLSGNNIIPIPTDQK